jgi:hypothetical protein
MREISPFRGFRCASIAHVFFCRLDPVVVIAPKAPSPACVLPHWRQAVRRRFVPVLVRVCYRRGGTLGSARPFGDVCRRPHPQPR